MPNIPIAKPFLDDTEEIEVLNVLRSGWLSTGARCLEFENKMARFVGRRYGVSVNSGTSAIHLALIAAGLQPGDEVLVPAYTCVAALHPIEALGAQPVLVDIDLATFAIDESQLSKAITKRTRGVIFAHLFGIPGCIRKISEFCRKSNLFLIEDIALGIGAYSGDHHVGIHGDFACLSFHPRKTITTGEGGMVVTDSEDVAMVLQELRNYGASLQAWQRHRTGIGLLPKYHRVGFNYKLTDVQAAIGLAQILKLEDILSLRREIAHRYHEAFENIPWMTTILEPEGIRFGYQSYISLIGDPDNPSTRPTSSRDRLISYLADQGIAAVQAAQAMPNIGYYAHRYHWVCSDYPKAASADTRAIALPIYPTLSKDEQDIVIKAVLRFKPHV